MKKILVFGVIMRQMSEGNAFRLSEALATIERIKTVHEILTMLDIIEELYNGKKLFSKEVLIKEFKKTLRKAKQVVKEVSESFPGHEETKSLWFVDLERHCATLRGWEIAAKKQAKK